MYTSIVQNIDEYIYVHESKSGLLNFLRISMMTTGMIMMVTLTHQAVSPQEVINLLISSGGVIVQINSMTSPGMNIGRESPGRREDRLGTRRNRSRFPTHMQTVASTERHIIRTIDDINGSCEVALRRQTSDSQEFTDSHRFLVVFGISQKTGVEIGRVEEEIYIAAQVRAVQVPGCVVRVPAVESSLLEVGAAEEHWHIVGTCRIPGEHECSESSGYIADRATV